jgi:hypothetical protein
LATWTMSCSCGRTDRPILPHPKTKLQSIKRPIERCAIQHDQMESRSIKFNHVSHAKIGLFFIVSDRWHCRHFSEFPANSVRSDLFINSFWSWLMNERQPTRLLFGDDKNNVHSW